MLQFGFAQIRFHPQMIQRNDRHQQGARMDAIPDLRFSFGDISRYRSTNLLACILQVRFDRAGVWLNRRPDGP